MFTSLSKPTSTAHSVSSRIETNWLQIAILPLVLVAAAVMLFGGLGSFPLFNPDEALYAQPAQEMLQTGDFLTTTLNYVVRFTKPPLVIWAMALSYQLMGVNEFAARFVGAACGLILVGGVYSFLCRYVSTRAGVIGALSLASAPLFVAVSREAITDMPLALFLSGSLMCFYRAFTEQQRSFSWMGFVLIGLAVMTKGPVGALLPILIMGVYHLARGNAIQAWQFYKPLAGALIVAVIALPWFVTEIVVTKGAYFNDFILRENFQRFTSVVDKHKGGWWYHLAAMFGGFFPWSVFVPQALFAALRPAQNITRNSRWSWLFAYRQMSTRQDLLFFSACCAIITLLFFSASVSKLIPYTLPAFPALAILLAGELEQIFAEGLLTRLLPPLAVLAITYGGTGVMSSFIFSKVRHVPAGMFEIAKGLLSFQCLATTTAIVLTFLRRPVAAVGVFLAFTLASTAYFGYKGAQLFSAEREAPIPDFARFAAASGEPMLVYKIRKPSVIFYARRPTILSPNQEGLTIDPDDQLNKLGSAYVIANSFDDKHFLSQAGYKLVSKDGAYILLHWQNPR